jgi:hypothetical protein
MTDENEDCMHMDHCTYSQSMQVLYTTSEQNKSFNVINEFQLIFKCSENAIQKYCKSSNFLGYVKAF